MEKHLRLDHIGICKTEIVIVANYEVIQYFDIQILSCLNQFVGNINICLRRLQVA